MQRPSTLPRPQSAIIPGGTLDLPHISDEQPNQNQETLPEVWRRGAQESLDNTPEKRVSRVASVSNNYPWLQRLSTISPSQGSSSYSSPTPRPGTPSVLSNGSSVPFFRTPQPVISRNKLVKRSTSQRALQTDYSPGSPFASASSTPSFRRPATSHQRSEHLRIQNLQRDLGNRHPRTGSPTQQVEELQDIQGAGHTEDTQSHSWLPFFRSKSTAVRQDISLRGSGSRLRGLSGTVRRVILSSEASPTLVMASSVKKPAMEQVMDVTSSDTSNSMLNSDFDPPTNQNDGTDASPENKSRTSFSISGLLPSSSPSWKRGRGGSLKRRKGRESSNMDRRVASAPGQAFREHGSEEGVHRSRHNVDFGVEEVPLPSSTLDKPSLGIETDRLELPSSRNHHHAPRHTSSPPIIHSRQAPIVNSTLLHPLPSRSRTSRVPSDHDSTVFESDNEQSRVFSADGDDTDYRSETVYDSIRTEATGSSHSGARGSNIENFFGDRQSPDLVKQNLTRLQEQLAGASLKNSADLVDYIAEEEEGSHTPIPPSVRSDIHSLPSDSRRVSRQELFDSPTSPSPILHKDGRSKNGHDIGDGHTSDSWSIDEDKRSTTVTGLNLSSPKDERPQYLSSSGSPTASSNPRKLPGVGERPKSNIFEWSERQAVEKDPQDGSSPRPKTAHAQQIMERGGRSAGRRGTSGYHLRSQSVPLPPDNSSHRFNNTSKLDSWILGGKGVSEDWDGDFEFDEPAESGPPGFREDTEAENSSDTLGVVVPRSIMERQASVHGQFGQVKELTLLVEELRRLQRSAIAHGILNSQSSELWKEAEGIIDLATLDEEETFFSSHSPHSTSFDFDAFDDDFVTLPRRRKSSVSPREDIQQLQDSSTASQPASHSSPSGSKLSTPQSRPRKESVAKAKHVLENIHQHRSSLDPPLVASMAAPKKLPFDTTSLRDLVTRAGVVTRALKEIIRRIEDPDYAPNTPERRPDTPPDPPFSQIFHQPASPTVSKKALEY